MTVKTTYEAFKYEAGKNFEIFKSEDPKDIEKCLKYLYLIFECSRGELASVPYKFRENLDMLVVYTSSKTKIEISLDVSDPVYIQYGWMDSDSSFLKKIAQKAIFDKLIKYEILKKEHIPNFEKFVVLGKRMMIQEIVEILCNYHRVPEENILDTFFNLREANKIEGATASFSEGVSNALSLYHYDKDGKILSDERIDRYNGRPVNHIG